MPLADADYQLRRLTFEHLQRLTDTYGDVLPFEVLRRGFDFEGVRVPLLGPQGIFKPRVMHVPLTITTAPNGPCADSFSDDGLLLYRYRGDDPNHRDNVGLRELKGLRRPLVYLTVERPDVEALARRYEIFRAA